MRNFLYLIAMMVTVVNVSAQTLLSENFDDGIPSTWVTIDSDEDGNGWMSMTDLALSWNETWASLIPNYVNGGVGDAAASASANAETFAAYNPDNWLFSPALTIPESGAFVLTWYARSMRSSLRDHYAVYITPSADAASAIAAGVVFEETATNAYTQQTVSLASYAGQTVYVAFRHFDSGNNQAILIDDVVVDRVATTEPEIALSAIVTGDRVSAGVEFEVSALVENHSSTPLTSFEVSYSLDGGEYVAWHTVSGINLMYGESYTVVHPTGAMFNTTGVHTLSIKVANPNESVDDESDNTMSKNISSCSYISALPYEEGFENGLGCWSAYSANEANRVEMGTGRSWLAARSGEEYFQFASYNSANDYSQYLISPELSLSTNAIFSFYCAKAFNNSSEMLQVMVSGTSDEISAFEPLGDIVHVPYASDGEGWEFVSIVLPANAKYVAIKYVATNQFFVGIDDISLEEASMANEVALTGLDFVSPIDMGEPLRISCRINNNGYENLTSFTFAYYIDSVLVESFPVTGADLAYNHRMFFEYVIMSQFNEPGTYRLTCTISNPNGVEDIAIDNSLTEFVEVCEPVTELPYTETFDDTLGCWTILDNDGDGKSWTPFCGLMRQWFDTVYPLYLYGQTGDAMASYSFDQAASEPLVPDNWLISPAIELPYDRFCEASWYSMLFNNQYPDTYAVYVVENKSINSMIYEAPVLIDSVSAGDTLVHHTIRLDEYVGKRVHIAFRHFRSPGMFGLLIDQFSVYATADNPNPQSIERAEMSIVSIYPNPSRDKVRIEATAAIRELKLYDMNGKEVMRCEGCDELEIGAVAEGVYFLEVTTAERQSIHKVIKQ